MVKVLLCGVFILLAAILLSIGGTMLQHLFSVRKKCGLKIIGTVSGFQVEQRRKTKRYYPVFEFEIKGCRYQGKSHYGTREPRYRLHQPVALQVDARYFVRLYERKELIRTRIFCAVCCSVGGIALFLSFLFAFSPSM